MKHFLNDPSSIALAALQGLCALNPRLSLDTVNKGEHLHCIFNLVLSLAISRILA